jgi:hypothetical protein
VTDTALIARQQLFHARGDGLRLGEAGILRQLQVDHQFGPVGRGKELAGHADLEQQHRAHEHGERDRHHRLAPIEAAVEHAPEPAVEAAFILLLGLSRVVSRIGALGQQMIGDERREDDRDDPRQDQRHGDDLEQRDHIFAGCRLRHGDRQEARDGDERADQHRHRGGGRR